VPAQFEMTGATQLANLSKALRAAGQNELRKQLLASIRKATAPAKTGIPDSARRTLPRRGGANEYFANAIKVASRTSLSGQQATVRLVAADPPDHDIQSIDRHGRLRHPTRKGPGWSETNREVWRNTKVEPGFFTNYCLSLAPEARRQIAAGTNYALAQIARATL